MPALVRPGRDPPAKAEKATMRTMREAELWGAKPWDERKPSTPAVAAVRSGRPTRRQLVRRMTLSAGWIMIPYAYPDPPINYIRRLPKVAFPCAFISPGA